MALFGAYWGALGGSKEAARPESARQGDSRPRTQTQSGRQQTGTQIDHAKSQGRRGRTAAAENAPATRTQTPAAQEGASDAQLTRKGQRGEDPEKLSAYGVPSEGTGRARTRHTGLTAGGRAERDPSKKAQRGRQTANAQEGRHQGYQQPGPRKPRKPGQARSARRRRAQRDRKKAAKATRDAQGSRSKLGTEAPPTPRQKGWGKRLSGGVKGANRERAPAKSASQERQSRAAASGRKKPTELRNTAPPTSRS